MAVSLSVESVRALGDPYAPRSPWGCRPITHSEVLAAVKDGRFCRKQHRVDWNSKGLTRKEHIERIAFFVVHGSADPISIDVGVPALGCHVAHPLQDGHHRLAAAILRGDKYINAEVSGQLDYAAELFGVDCTE